MNISIQNIGVVIVTFQRPDALQRTINAILNQGILEKNIWVVNNNPKSPLKAQEVDSSLKFINILNQIENLASAGGFALGMNKVLESGLNWVWLFNDDSRPLKDTFQSLQSALLGFEEKSIGLVKIANLNEAGLATLLNWKGVRVPSYVPVSQNLVETDLVTFDGCLISTELIKAIGTCDPDYFMGTYEFDFCLRAKDNGYKIYTLPNGLIEDEKLGSINGTPPWRQYYNTRNHLHLGISRKDPRIIWAWMVREVKFTYAILRFKDKKLKSLKMKLFAFIHAVQGKRGKIFGPETEKGF